MGFFINDQIRRGFELVYLNRLEEAEAEECTLLDRKSSFENKPVLDAIQANDKEKIAAELLEMGYKGITPHSIVLKKLACFLMQKNAKGRPKGSEKDNNRLGKWVAEDYGRGKAQFRFKGLSVTQNKCSDLKNEICKHYGINSRYFDDFVSANKVIERRAYQRELLRWDELEEELDEKGQAELEQAKRDLAFEIELNKNWGKSAKKD